MLKLVFFFALIGLPLFSGPSELLAQTRKQPSSAAAPVKKRGQLIPSTEKFTFYQCVADNGYIYWLGYNQLVRVNRDDGKDPQVLIETNTRIGNFAVDGNNFYYMSENKDEHRGGDFSSKVTGELRRVDLTKGNISTVLNGFRWPGLAFIQTDSQYLYFLEGSDNIQEGLVLLRLAKSGGEPERITSGLKAPNGFVVDDKNIYWSDFADNSVRKIAKTGGKQIVLFDGNENQAAPATMTSDEQYLYLLERTGKIYQIEKENGKWKIRFTYRGNDFDLGAPISADKESIFWPLGSRVMRLSKKGGVPTVVSLSGSASRCVVADDKYIYWNEQHRGLMRIPK